jgi:hypothetical protein
MLKRTAERRPMRRSRFAAGVAEFDEGWIIGRLETAYGVALDIDELEGVG